MRVKSEMPNERMSESPGLNPETSSEAGGDYAPRKLSATENVVLTFKVLGVAGFLLAILWVISVWTEK